MGVRPFNAHFKLFIIIKTNKKMSTKIEYFGDFISSIIISEDKFKYLENAGVEILSCKEHDSKPLSSGEKQFDISFKVNNITFLNFMHAGIKYSLDKYWKP